MPTARVSVRQEEWDAIGANGVDRGIFVEVDDADIPRDKHGVQVVTGAFGVGQEEVVLG